MTGQFEAARLAEYYQRRAQEYERVYFRDDPVRLAEQAALAEAIGRAVTGRRVLEVACGTGYWTQAAAATAAQVVGIDAAPATLEIARSKVWPDGRVEFRLGDAYDLGVVPGEFDAGLACFWLSHVPRARLGEFLDGLHGRLEPGAVVFCADNVYVEGIGGELVVRPGEADTYKRRRLPDGSVQEVLKNYYGGPELRDLLSPYSKRGTLEAHVGECFWWARYVVGQQGSKP